MQKSVSLIVSFYNNIGLLKMIFSALERQSFKDFEVVIADDGSSQDVVDEIRRYTPRLNFPVQHCWHEDEGWKKNASLNQAIQLSQGGYLIFIDGDCIPHRRFVEEHFSNRQEGIVVTGRRIQLSESMTKRLTMQKVSKGYLEGWGLVRIVLDGLIHHVKHLENALRIRDGRLRRILIQDKENGILGCNFSLFKTDILKVNGFDERFQHPGTGEDTDLNSRLLRAGIKTLSKKHLLTIYHIHHQRFNLKHLPNLNLWYDNNEKKVTFTPYGIVKKSPSPSGESEN